MMASKPPKNITFDSINVNISCIIPTMASKSLGPNNLAG